MSFYITSSLLPYFFSAAGLAALVSLVARYLSTAQSHESPAAAFPQDNLVSVRALPASWYRSKEVYELERRAIFAKKWILTSHKLRFTEPGSWVRFEQANFQFILVKDKQGKMNGFRSKRHDQDLPIMTKTAGHGDLDGFDMAKNDLLPIHVLVDAKGFIWINLDASKTPENWSAEFKGIDQMARHESFGFDDYYFDHTWGMSGDYNWKTLADNYNECYHCKTAHPDVDAVADLSAYRVEPKGGNIEHFASTTPEQEQNGLKIVSNYYFPNSCMTVSPNFFYMMRCVPTSAGHCSMEYEVYRHKNATDEDFRTIDEMFKRILSEDKWLCNNAQKNLNAGVFVNGEMHPKMEQGPLYFQHRIRGLLNDHYQKEKAMGKEINLAH
ncbi:hypothetical protein F66182_10174 [Fusarium sp. NRRL 66182]|nr:hypothetical protein F66182_10174 [Fusarium sp. NRRL 66182]